MIKTDEFMHHLINEEACAFLWGISNNIKKNNELPEVIYRPDLCKVILEVEKRNEDRVQNLKSITNRFLSFYKVQNPNETREKITDIIEKTNSVVFEFWIDAIQFHELMMNTSGYYAGYHENGSFLDLAFPNFKAMKENVVCCFPVLQVAEDCFIPRNAGCNFTQVIQTQLAYHVNKILLNEQYVERKHFYSHHEIQLLTDHIIESNLSLVEIAFKCLGIEYNKCHQQEDGVTIYKLEDNNRQYVVEMDQKSRDIYRFIAATPPAELNNLSLSVEVPLQNYFSILLEDSLLPRKEQLLNEMKARNEDAIGLKYTQKSLDLCEKGIQSVKTILEHLDRR